VNAGHPAGVLIDGASSRLMKASGPPAGMFASSRFTSEVLSMHAGDLGVVVTDGVTEAIEQDDEESSVLIARALQQPDARPTPEAACDAVMQLAAGGRGPAGVADWHDDRTVVTFMVARS
jgi:serine phosphatase RsbU (regulator of sigma subunit)